MAELFEWDSAAVSALALPTSGSSHADSTAAGWQECGAEGFLVKPLLEDSASGLRTWLMKVEPGAWSELHSHDELEQIFVLEGSFYDQEKTYRAGEYIVRAAGAMHTAGSETGATVLLFYSPKPGMP